MKQFKTQKVIQTRTTSMDNKQLDSYSMLICSKYLKSTKDFINVMCVCKKFKETTEKLRFNPIPIESSKLFPNMQTQYLYSKDDKIIEGIDNYDSWYKVDFSRYKILKNTILNVIVWFTQVIIDYDMEI